jgi:hypothetical protein
MESSISVQYNSTTPMLQFRFGTRQSANEGANWNNNQNAYWFPNFAGLVDLVSKMGALLKTEAGSDSAYANFKNPKKQKYLTLRKNIDTNNNKIWYMFSYTSGSDDNGNKFQCSCSLDETEFTGMYAYLKNLLSQYPTIAQNALVRYDYWYQMVGKHKQNNNNGNNQYNQNNNGKYQQNQPYNNSSGQYNQNNNGQPNTSPGQFNDGMMNNIRNEFNSPPVDDDDIPF